LKIQGLDMARLIEEPDELLDAELVGMFPKGRTRISEAVMVKTADGTFLLRKDDIALDEKRHRDAVRLACILAYEGAVALLLLMMANGVLNASTGLTIIGTSILAACAMHEAKKRRRQSWYL